MSLIKKLSLVGTLGELRRNGALTDAQFERLKNSWALAEDLDISQDGEETLATLAEFWRLRGDNILTDHQYQDQAIYAFDILGVEPPEGSSRSRAAGTASPIEQPASKRARRDSGGGSHSGLSLSPALGTRTGGGFGSGGRSAVETRHGLVPAGEEEQTEEEKEEEGDERMECYSETTRCEGDENDADNVEDIDISHKCFVWNRWMRTKDFEAPRGCLEGLPALRIVDATSTLLKNAREKRFPNFEAGYTGDRHPLKARLKRQGGMYCLWKKVMLCEGNEVFRATGEEIEETVEEVKRSLISKQDYFDGVIEVLRRKENVRDDERTPRS